jgi:hypothetical protein
MEGCSVLNDKSFGLEQLQAYSRVQLFQGLLMSSLLSAGIKAPRTPLKSLAQSSSSSFFDLHDRSENKNHSKAETTFKTLRYSASAQRTRKTTAFKKINVILYSYYFEMSPTHVLNYNIL